MLAFHGGQRRVHMSRVLLTLAIFQVSRDHIDHRGTGRWREMRSEKEQITVGKEKSVVEIQFRDIPGEQENASGNTKQKEEKKEVFTKVGIECWRCRSVKQTWTEVGSLQHRGQRQTNYQRRDSVAKSATVECSYI